MKIELSNGRNDWHFFIQVLKPFFELQKQFIEKKIIPKCSLKIREEVCGQIIVKIPTLQFYWLVFNRTLSKYASLWSVLRGDL